MSSIYNIGMRSLLTFESAIAITAQNIENANVPYYARRSINFVEAMSNNGVKIGDVRRVVDDSLDNSVIEKMSYTGRYNELASRLTELEQILGDKDANVNKFLHDAITSLNELSTNVSSLSARSNFLSKLDALARKINSTQTDLDNRRAETNQSLTQQVDKVNQLLSHLGDINEQIANTSGDKGALLDQQYDLLGQLGELMNVSTYRNDDGTVEISMENGLDLLRGSDPSLLSTTPNAEQPATNLDIVVTKNGTPMNVTNLISSGSIKGLMDYRATAIDPTSRGLSRLALGLQDAINKQNKLGIDLNGDIGQNLFSDINSSNLINSRVLPNLNNTGSMSSTVTITDTSQLTNSDYELVFDSSTHYQLVKKSDQTVISSGDITSYPATISADGFSMNISAGSFTAGDRYTISPTRNAAHEIKIDATDASKLALGYPVTTSPAAQNTGSGIISVTGMTDTSTSAFSINKQLNPPIRIEFLSDTSYQIVNANDNSVMEGPLTYDPDTGTNVFPTAGGYDPGYRVNLTGIVKSGDTFNISYNNDPSADNRNALEMNKISNNSILDNGKLTLAEAYNNITGNISSITNSARTNAESANIMLEQAENRRAQRSGVSISEEAVNMAQLQEAYAASAQVIQTAKNIFDILLSVTAR